MLITIDCHARWHNKIRLQVDAELPGQVVVLKDSQVLRIRRLEQYCWCSGKIIRKENDQPIREVGNMVLLSVPKNKVITYNFWNKEYPECEY